MKKNQTLYDDWTVDFRRILICSGIIALSAFPNINESKALAVAILIQGASNIDSYWDFLREKGLCESLKNMLICLITLSSVSFLIALLSLINDQNYFEIKKFGGIIQWGTLVAVCFPVFLLFTDLCINRRNEEGENSIKYNQNGGEDDEL